MFSYTTLSHILTCNIQKCYMDYFLCRPIYAYPHTIQVIYYDTMVLIRNKYFCHQISEVVYLPWIYMDSCICQRERERERERERGSIHPLIWYATKLCSLVIYMKLIWHNGFAEIYAQLEEGGWCKSAMGDGLLESYA